MHYVQPSPQSTKTNETTKDTKLTKEGRTQSIFFLCVPSFFVLFVSFVVEYVLVFVVATVITPRSCVVLSGTRG